MRDRKRSGLLRKRERKLPNQNDGCVNKNRKSSVLKFAGEIVADPRIRAQQRQMAFAPTTRDIREHRQDRQLVIVVPKNERIVPKQKKAKYDNDCDGAEGAEPIASLK